MLTRAFIESFVLVALAVGLWWWILSGAFSRFYLGRRPPDHPHWVEDVHDVTIWVNGREMTGRELLAHLNATQPETKLRAVMPGRTTTPRTPAA